MALCTAVGVKRDLSLFNGCTTDEWKQKPLCVPDSQSNDDFAQPQNRVLTCFPTVDIGKACPLEEQCQAGICCRGMCNELVLDPDDDLQSCVEPAAGDER